MRSTHSFAINFIGRSNKSNQGKASLYARISLDGQRLEIFLKEKVPIKDWDTIREQVKGKTIEVKSLNQHIDE